MNEAEAIKTFAEPQTHFLLRIIADNWINLIFGLIGAVGTIYGFMSWRSAQKDKRSYKFLFDLAEKNIDKNITEETIKQKKKEVQRATSEIESLQRQIKKDIPKEARKAVLKDKLNSQYLELTNIFKNVCKSKEELSSMSESDEIPPDLLEEIEKEIRPEYLLKEERENLKTYLTVCTTLAAIASAALPWAMSRLVGGLFLFAGLGVLIQLIRNIFATTSRNNQIRIATYGYIVGFVASAALAIGDFYLFIAYGTRYRVSTEMYIIMALLAAITFITLMVSMKLFRIKVRYSEVLVEAKP